VPEGLEATRRPVGGPHEDGPLGGGQADVVQGEGHSGRRQRCAPDACPEPPDETSPQLSYELAAQVELAPEAKQDLLESRSEQERLELVAELLDVARQTLIATRELGERAKRNGSRH